MRSSLIEYPQTLSNVVKYGNSIIDRSETLMWDSETSFSAGILMKRRLDASFFSQSSKPKDTLRLNGRNNMQNLY